MRYHVLVRNGWQTKAMPCSNLDEACDYANWAAFLLDIKIKKNLPKKDWTKWDNDTCFFEYDVTSDNYKDDGSHLSVSSHSICPSPYMAKVSHR